MSVQIPKTIFLFGHRQGHGKDTCCDILEKMLQKEDICYIRTSFAKKLKQHSAERYGLDASKMDSQEYKDWCPPHVRPKMVTLDFVSLEQLRGIVRDSDNELELDGQVYKIFDISIYILSKYFVPSCIRMMSC